MAEFAVDALLEDVRVDTVSEIKTTVEGLAEMYGADVDVDDAGAEAFLEDMEAYFEGQFEWMGVEMDPLLAEFLTLASARGLVMQIQAGFVANIHDSPGGAPSAGIGIQ